MNLIVGDRNPVTSPERHAQIPKMIIERWQSWDLPAEAMPIWHQGFTGCNVWVGPKNPNKPFVLLTAHHDTVPNCPGLDDNGSGMAVIDAIAKMYVDNNNGLNLAFCMPDFEEGDPRIWNIVKDLPKDILEDADLYWEAIYEELSFPKSFIGSHNLYRYLRIDSLILKNLEVVLNFDTVGYKSENQAVPPRVPKYVARKAGEGDFVAVLGNRPAKKWMKNIKYESRRKKFKTVSLTVPRKGNLMPDTRRSDHAVFWDNKHPAIFFTDTANFRNPNYHLPTDVEVDSAFIAETAEFIYDLLIKERR